MSHLRRHVVTLLLLVPLVCVFGKLLLTSVRSGDWERPGYYTAGMSEQFATYERGWPWVFERFTEPFPGLLDQATSWLVVAADLASMALGVAVIGLLLARHRRRRGKWLRFSLRELLAVTGLIAVVLGWWVSEQARWNRDQPLLAELESGARIEREIYIGPQWLRRLLPPEDLVMFNRPVSAGISLSTDGLEKVQVVLPKIPQLRRLIMWINDHTVNNWQTRRLSSKRVPDPRLFCHIEELVLYDTATDDTTFEFAAQIDGLRSIQASDSAVTDFGIAAIARCTSLKSLDVSGTGITDAALNALASVRTLEQLNIAGCPQITSEGARRLLDAPYLKELTLPGPPQISQATLHELEGRIPVVSPTN